MEGILSNPFAVDFVRDKGDKACRPKSGRKPES